MRLAVDVMGGDHGPEELLQGVKLGLAAEPSISCLHVVGPPDELGALLGRIGCTDPRVRIHPASEVLTMDDKPVQGLRRKKDSSILRAVELVRDGLADAVISSGNTGGIVAAATIRLRTLEGIERPTIACIMPSKSGAWVLVDGGANPECTPENLLQFGVMGSVYSRAMLGRQHPRVGVLSNGSEESKGTDLTRAAVALIRVSGLHATGYCEGYDLFMDGSMCASATVSSATSCSSRPRASARPSAPCSARSSMPTRGDSSARPSPAGACGGSGPG